MMSTAKVDFWQGWNTIQRDFTFRNGDFFCGLQEQIFVVRDD